MNDLARLLFGTLLLLMALSLALTYLSGPMSLLKRAGVAKAIKWCIGGLWKAAVLVFELVTRTRKLRIRRPGARQTVRRAG